MRVAKDVSSAVVAVREARDRTIEARTARLWHVHSLFRDDGTETLQCAALGAADLTHRRTHTTEQSKKLAEPTRPPIRAVLASWPLGLVLGLVLWLVSRFYPPFRRGVVGFLRQVWQPQERLAGPGVSYGRAEGGRVWTSSELDLPGNLYLWLLDVLADATDDLLVLGLQEVRGVWCRHYRVAVRADDPKSIMGVVSEQTASALGSGVPIEVWLDRDGRVRRLSWCQYERSSSREWTSPAWSCEVLELWDFGVDMRIEFPATANVRRWAELEDYTEGPLPPSPFEEGVVFP
jgi:hypothetical protein